MTFTMTRFTSLLLFIMIMFFIIMVMLKKGVQQSTGQGLLSPLTQRWILLGKKKRIIGNKQEDVQLSTLSPSASNNNPQNPVAGQQTGKSEAMNYSLPMDASTNVSALYNLSLIDVYISTYPSKVPAANPGSR